MATRPFGPNTALVERFLTRLALMTLDDFRAVVQRWRDTVRRTDGWYAAEDGVGDAIAHTRRDDEMWLLQDHIYAIFRGRPWYTLPQPGSPVAPAEVASQYTSTTAAMALMVADKLSAAQLTTLYAPFAEMIPLSDLTPTVPSREPETKPRAASADDPWRDDRRSLH